MAYKNTFLPAALLKHGRGYTSKGARHEDGHAFNSLGIVEEI
jgi:hypothetical protein